MKKEDFVKLQEDMNSLKNVISQLAGALQQKSENCTHAAEENMMNYHRNCGAVATCQEFAEYLKKITAKETTT